MRNSFSFSDGGSSFVQFTWPFLKGIDHIEPSSQRAMIAACLKKDSWMIEIWMTFIIDPIKMLFVFWFEFVDFSEMSIVFCIFFFCWVENSV